MNILFDFVQFFDVVSFDVEEQNKIEKAQEDYEKYQNGCFGSRLEKERVKKLKNCVSVLE